MLATSRGLHDGSALSIEGEPAMTTTGKAPTSPPTVMRGRKTRASTTDLWSQKPWMGVTMR
ncbi:hypothetical protein DF3PB_3480003 [uncultured Defluviicoccus sp.]|uniref:Uncharacterized protein n=1 Tax=metagenome TaxID=256318 RepID=A0A380TFI5_9ZZZZ|nr:hypothetical protein DF3PB_3480003 [uncultured Defluviicoccus sp.]